MMKAIVFCGLVLGLAASAYPRLPLPEPNIPEMPPLAPTVVTAGGQLRFLSEFPDARLSWNGKSFSGNLRGWWLVNFPFERISASGGTRFDEAARRRVFGEKAVKNWYIRLPGTPAPEPSLAVSPAPIRLSAHPAFVVDQNDPAAQYRTIKSALEKAKEGDVIRIKYGVYREELKMTTPHVTLEGERDALGRMPVVSANRLFPEKAWTFIGEDIWKARVFTGLEGSVSCDGVRLRERSCGETLGEGECCFNRGSEEFMRIRDVSAMAKTSVVSDANGFFDLSATNCPNGCVRWAETWVWVEPKVRKGGVVWDANCPLPITGRVRTKGDFRIGRQNGSHDSAQVNQYKLWVNGRLVPGPVEATIENGADLLPHATMEYGRTDEIRAFRLNEGWNHLVFQFDTTRKAKSARYRFPLPKGIGRWAISPVRPLDMTTRGDTAWTNIISSIALSEPFAPGSSDRCVYVRLAKGRDPNTCVMDLSSVGTVLSMTAPFCTVRGVEFRHGSQFQQRALVRMSGEGCVFEYCRITEPTTKGIAVSLGGKDQQSSPIIVRGCHVIRPGNVGIGVTTPARNPKLTAENQSTRAPGRGRAILEYNLITDNNWGAHQALWESGAFKCCNISGCVIRYNEMRGGHGPGIWMDWQNYNNRLEGNRHIDGWGFLVGVEASPGPNLICNNVSINQRPADVWFRFPFLAWSSARYWCINNSIDGKFNKTKAWKGLRGSGAFHLNEGKRDRRTAWEPIPEQRGHLLAHNTVTNIWDACPPLSNAPTAVDALVRHDANGLLRFGEKRTPGAWRRESATDDIHVEIEYADGTCRQVSF